MFLTMSRAISLILRSESTKSAQPLACIETLESRQLLSTIAWDGGATGNGTNMLDPLNWAGDVLPAAADDLVIGATGTSPGLTLTGTLAATNVTSSRAIQINSGGNLTLSGIADQSATLTVNGGTLTGGVWNMGAQNVVLSGTTAVLSGPVINGAVSVNTTSQFTVGVGTRFTLLRQTASAGTFKILAEYILRDAVQVDAGASFTFQGTQAGSQLTIQSTGTVSATGNTTFTGGTLLNNGVIAASGAAVLTISIPVVNAGVIRSTPVASGTGNGLVVTGASFQNDGTVTIGGSGSNRIQSTTFSDSGLLNVQTELLISSGMTWANVNSAGIVNTGAIVIDGTIDNTGTTFHLTASMGNVYFQRGTIQGGTLTCDSGTALKFQGTTGSVTTLRDVTVTNEILLQDRLNNYVQLRLAGTTTFPRMRVLLGNLTFEQYTLNSEISFENNLTSSSITFPTGQTTSSIGPAGIIRLSATAVGAVVIVNTAGNAAVRNRGLIEALAPTREILFTNNWINNGEIRVTGGQSRSYDDTTGTPASFVNEGVINVTSGGKFTFQNASWSSPGAINANAGTIVLAGTWRSDAINLSAFTAVNSTVSITGTVDNTDLILTLNATTGSWQFKGATLVGGVVDATAADLQVVPTGTTTFNNVQINGIIRSTGQITLAGSTRFTRVLMLDAPSTGFTVGYTLRDEILVSGPGTVNVNRFVGGGGSIAPSGSIHFDATATGGLWVSSNGLVNHGLIYSETATRVGFGFSGGYFINAGTIRAGTGALMTVDPTTFVNPGLLDIQGGTIRLDGTIQGSEFNGPGVTNNGGTFALNGILYNAGNVLSLPNAGSMTLLTEAEINGGTLVLAPGAALIAAGTGNSVIINDLIVQNEIIVTSRSIDFGGTSRFSAIRLRGAASVSFPAGYTLRDNIYAEGAVAGARGVGFASATGRNSTIAPGVTIELSAGAGGEFQIGAGTLSTLVNLGTIRAVTGPNRLRVVGSFFTNSGTITADGGSISIEALSWTNNGPVSSIGGTLSLSGVWNSTSSINLQNSVTTLGGTFSTIGLNLGSLSRTGGTLTLSGAWDNSAQSISLAGTLGPIVLSGGRLSGGTLATTSVASISILSPGNELNSVQIDGDFIVLSSGSVTVRGSTRFGTAYMRGLASLIFENNFVLQDRIVSDSATAGARTLSIATAGVLTIGATGSILMSNTAAGSDLTIRSVSGVSTFINNGQLVSSGGPSSFTMNTTTFTNNGIMQVTSGRLQFTTGTMTSPGQFAVSGGILTLGGTFNTTGFDPSHVNRTGGSIEIGGTLSNTGRTLTLNANTGSWTIAAAVVSSGNIILNDGVVLNVTGTSIFQGPIIAGDLVVLSAASATLQTGTRFGTLHLRGTANTDPQNGFVLLDAIVADGAETGTRSLRMTGALGLTIGASGSLRLAADSGGDLAFSPTSNVTLSNGGLISNDSATRTLTLRVTPFTNTGTIQAVGGTITITGAVTNIAAGVLTGGTWRVADGGQIAGIANILVNNAAIVLDGNGGGFGAISGLQSNSGTLALGGTRQLTITPVGGTFTQSGVLTLGAGSHLVISGTFTQTSVGQLSVRIAGTAAAQIGSVSATANATIGGSLTISFAAGYTPNKLDSFDVVLGSTVSGTFANVTLPDPLPVGRNFLLFPGNAVRFVVSSLADTNLDGVVDFFDYLDFVQLFSTSDPLSDFNSDGAVDFFDYLDFVNEFSQF